MYSYDRTKQATQMDPLMRLIVQRALEDRSISGLVDDWVEDRLEEWGEENSGGSDNYKAFLRAHQMLDSEREVELALQRGYVPTYRQLWGGSKNDALAALDYPDRIMPKHLVPTSIAVAIGKAMAERDALEAKALRELARARQG